MDDTRTTLLVAERDDSTRSFLLDNLAADGYAPLGAQTGEEALVKFRNHAPALVLLGGLGEGCRPLSLVRAIRSGDAGGDPTVPVIVLAARTEQLAVLRAFEAGCMTSCRCRSPTSSFAPASVPASGGRGDGGCLGGSWPARRWSTATRARPFTRGESCGSAGSSSTCLPTRPRGAAPRA